jgi:hypothetical protein
VDPNSAVILSRIGIATTIRNDFEAPDVDGTTWGTPYVVVGGLIPFQATRRSPVARMAQAVGTWCRQATTNHVA